MLALICCISFKLPEYVYKKLEKRVADLVVYITIDLLFF
jgi:hypothetical protein